ncbi:MAG: topoisomerase IV [Clostridia bacterium]|nr:topoisomerase IV [Clostridia bacterium]
MAKKKKTSDAPLTAAPENTHIAGSGIVEVQPIVDTLESNYMPYAMSVIMSRAIPEIDGFKPSHRKLLYTMYKMGLLTGARTKSANIVGMTMKLNPHGDAAIYDTMVRLSRGNQSLLHPYVDSKGNFGLAYSSDVECAAPRYTEAKLDPLAGELFEDIDKDTVDFVDNYDATTKEPTLLPVRFPSLLVNNNLGIAVGMASNICSFNLKEVCDTAAALIQDPEHDIASTLLAPDFPGGGYVIYDRDEIEKIYQTGRGSVRVRARYHYDKSAGCIDITEIPYTTTVEAIIAKTIDLVKAGKFKEIKDIRNETDKNGLKITIDIKGGTDPDRLMNRLFAQTPLEDAFPCNFNILIAGVPQVLGVRRMLEEWTAFRVECVRRRTFFEKQKAADKLHLLEGLAKILLDIDRAIAIIRSTEEETEVVPNLMIGFGIDKTQAEYVAEIKLRHLNREYILKRTQEIEALRATVEDLDKVLHSHRRVLDIIVRELRQISDKFGKPRRSEILYASDLVQTAVEEEEPVSDEACTFFFTAEGYFKKITPASLRMASEQKLKEGDRIVQTIEAGNNRDLLFFTNAATVYKAKAGDFAFTKASAMGDFVASTLGFDAGEAPIYMVQTTDYSGYMLFFFENGKAAKVELSAYATKTNRKKLIGAYYEKVPLVAAFFVPEDREFFVCSTSGKRLLLHSGAVPLKTTRTTQGVQVMTLRGKNTIEKVYPFTEGMTNSPNRYRSRSIPAAGALPLPEDLGEQLTWQ